MDVEQHEAVKLASKQSELPSKQMLDSYQEMIIPLEHDLKQRDKWVEAMVIVREVVVGGGRC